MDSSIDFGRYLHALLGRWQWIVLVTVITAVCSALLSFIQPTQYKATAAIFYSPVQSQLRLDERFVTTATIEAGSRRAGLIALARSDSIAARLSAETLKSLGLSGMSPTGVLGQIAVETIGDMITITASGATPEQAQGLANAWATTFVTNANELDALSTAPVGQEQMAAVQRQFAEAQLAYEQFVGSNRIAELDQQITATQNVISHTLEAEQARYDAYLIRANQLELVLRDADALRGQIADGNSISLGDSIALLMLRARINAGSVSAPDLPQNLVQLQIDLPSSIESGEGITLQDVEALITTLRKEIDNTRLFAATIATGLVDVEGTSETSVIKQDQASYYARLLDLMKQREAEEGHRLAFEQARDLALDALLVVQRKAAEQLVAAVQPDAEVHLVGNAPLPTSPSNPSALTLLVAGGLVGTLSSILLILMIEAFRTLVSRPRSGG